MRSLSKRKGRNGENIKSAQPLTHENIKSLYNYSLTKGDEGKRQFVSIIIFELLSQKYLNISQLL